MLITHKRNIFGKSDKIIFEFASKLTILESAWKCVSSANCTPDEFQNWWPDDCWSDARQYNNRLASNAKKLLTRRLASGRFCVR